MTPDPRTEEIRTRLAALHHDEAEFGGATAEDRFTRAAVGRMFDSDAPADLAYLLGRIEALENALDRERIHAEALRHGHDAMAAVVDAAADVSAEVRSADDEYGASPSNASVRLAAALDAWRAGK